VNLPFWVIHPTYCSSVTVRGIRVDSRNLNNDGTDPDSSEDVLIEDCWYNTGDDAIAVKSGRDQDAWRVGRPGRNIVGRNCHAENTLHGVAIGSEMAGGVENVYVQNFSMKKVDKYALQF
jgi:polygalacturonase